MNKIISLILTIACFALAEEGNQNISLYIHPISLAAGMGVDGEEEEPMVIISDEGLGLLLYLTLEIPLSEFNSIIVNPSSWWIGLDGEQSDTVVKRVGSGVGIRHFLYGESKGIYLQAMPSIHYLSLTEGREKNSGFFTDILGYIGYSVKSSPFAAFTDFGLGYAYTNVSKYFCHKGCLYFDINMGVGLSF